MSSRKRSFQAFEADSGDENPSLLHRIRNMWHFANLCQWIYTFGKAAKIPESIDVEEIEMECLKPNSPMLGDIALSILKLVSSHRGLTPDIFDEQTRKLFQARLPAWNPFGEEELPANFNEFDIFTKIRVLQQLTQWTMVHPERIRDKMDEQKDIEQTSWRIEPYGWDADDRTYYVLDDNRVYRMTEPPPAPTPKLKKSKPWRGGRRASKRRRTTIASEDQQSDTENGDNEEQPEDDGLGGMTWECLAVTLDDVQRIVNAFRKTRDENEKILRAQLEEHLLPILEKQEEGRKRKEAQRERELMNLAKMANAKRSSRIANKVEQQKQEEHAKEEERQRREAEAAKRREEKKNFKLELDRDQRLFSREKRLQEREARRLQHEEDLAQLSEDSKNLGNANGRVSERHLHAEIERNKLALKEIEQEEEDWVFDCACGLYGHVDDGTHSVACERCNVWQHSKCVGITEKEAERPEFQFICSSCRREQEAKARPKTTIKLKLHPSKSPNGKEQATQQPTNNSSHMSHRPSTKHPIASHRSKGQGPNRVPEHGSSTVASHPANGLPHTDVFPSNPRSVIPSPALGQSNNGSSPGTRPIIPAPVRLEAGGETQSNNTQSSDVGSPTASIKTTPTSNSFSSLHGGRSFESALRTPKISRDIYRAAYEQNGTLPAAEGGLSPTKHSPPRPPDARSASSIGITTPILPPVRSLSPSPKPQVLTPPSKASHPPQPVSSPSVRL
ncbi:hypothetical protein B0T10DRAFT_206723 [Thelonectria olida]|uniref:Zinc finger PHD-type domain-containing protein n=1 Tax=Thelonectria olida TaxID=1576542 RepID=A0A9P9AQG2_9HYPO|nr:hypothetical protein B0T10DRAFT_206723 [Thelonectria olida]